MVKENIFQLRQRIASVCSGIGRDPAGITVVAVSKGRTPDQIQEVICAGLLDIGENRIQEAILKYRLLSPNTYHLTPIRWHLVGHLQTNKVKEAVRIFELIHSVDSLYLAQEIDRQAAKANKMQDILMQINTSAEKTKFGLKPQGLNGLIKSILDMKNVRLKGLMTIAPIVDDPQKARPYFRMLRELRDQASGLAQLEILSMGMTEDFEVAIEEGANMVRLGRAIFAG